MNNKNNIIRQIYISIFNSQDDISTIINYKDITCEDKYKTNLPLFVGLTPRAYEKSKVWNQYKKMWERVPNGQFSIGGSIPIGHNIDIQRVRMFLFKYYIGKVEWEKLFFGQSEENT